MLLTVRGGSWFSGEKHGPAATILALIPVFIGLLLGYWWFFLRGGQPFSERLLHGIKQDAKMAQVTPMWQKVVFLLSNVGYFMLAIWCFSLTLPLRTMPHAPSSCRFGTIYYLSMGCIALASTSMHTAQMRLFGCSCCHSHSVEDLGVHKLKTEHALHTVPWQTLFKRMDVGCVFGGLSIGTLCQGGAITAAILPIIPIFLLAQRLKSQGHYQGYMVLHGLWHLFSAAGVWYVLLNQLILPTAE